MKKPKLTYTEFVAKWANRKTEGLTPEHQGGVLYPFAKIDTHFNYPVNDPILGNIKADVYWLPKALGWDSQKLRRQFYRDAKEVGLKKVVGKKLEYYYVNISSPQSL